jgi:PAS domain S-box-containing protein
MEHFQPELVEIRTILNTNPQGLSIQEIAEVLGANRNSVAKYLEILLIQGSVDLRKLGNAKIYFPSFRYPAESLKRLCIDGLLLLSHELTIVHCNNQLSDQLKSVPGAINGLPLSDLVYPLKAGDQILSLATAAVRGKEGSISIVPRWGSLWCELQLNLLPVVFSNGRPGAAVTVRGFHEKKCRGMVMAGSSDFERKLLDQMMEIYCRLSPDRTLIEVNRAFCRLSGRSHESLRGFRFKLLVPNEDWIRTSGKILALTPQSPVVTIKHRLLTGEGLVRWVLWKYRAVYSKGGGLREYLCTGLDITVQMNIKGRFEHINSYFEENMRKRIDKFREINQKLIQEISHRESVEQQLCLTQFGVDNAAEMILWIDRQGTITQINRQGMEILGYTIGEPLMPYIKRNVQQTSLENWEKFWKQLVHEGVVKQEWVIQRVDGCLIPVETVVNNLSYSGKEYACFFIRDISERKGYETALKKAEEQYRLMTDNTRDIIFRITLIPAISIDFISPSIELLTGYTPEHFYAHPTLLTHLLNEHDLQMLHSFIEDPELFKDPLTIRVRRPDMSWGWLEVSGVLIRSDEGLSTAVEGIGRDSLLRKKFETALAVERDRTNPCFDLASSLMMVIGKDLCVQMINRHGCRLLGYREKEIIGRNWIDHFVPIPDRDRVSGFCRDLLVDYRSEELRCQNPILTSDGAERQISWHISVLMDQNELPRSILAAGIEVEAMLIHQLGGR